MAGLSEDWTTGKGYVKGQVPAHTCGKVACLALVIAGKRFPRYYDRSITMQWNRRRNGQSSSGHLLRGGFLQDVPGAARPRAPSRHLIIHQTSFQAPNVLSARTGATPICTRTGDPTIAACSADVLGTRTKLASPASVNQVEKIRTKRFNPNVEVHSSVRLGRGGRG